jgi:hypothetical protein
VGTAVPEIVRGVGCVRAPFNFAPAEKNQVPGFLGRADFLRGICGLENLKGIFRKAS